MGKSCGGKSISLNQEEGYNLQGVVIRAVGGFYDVRTREGKEYRCRARGRFKKDRTSIYVGDRVEFTVNNGEGVLETVEPRRNFLHRPPVANIDQVIIVSALQNPPISLQLLDRLLVLAESRQLRAIICFNKADLPHDDVADPVRFYAEAGYKIFFTSAKLGQGIEALQKELCSRVSVFAGPSGAGKSSLLNRIKPGINLKTGAVSDKSKRGRHTTRHVELIPLEGEGFVADTPGFSQLELSEITSQQLPYYFPDFYPHAENCRFNTCMHVKEPDCGVKAAVEQGKILASRYENYLYFFDELKQQEREY